MRINFIPGLRREDWFLVARVSFVLFSLVMERLFLCSLCNKSLKETGNYALRCNFSLTYVRAIEGKETDLLLTQCCLDLGGFNMRMFSCRSCVKEVIIVINWG